MSFGIIRRQPAIGLAAAAILTAAFGFAACGDSAKTVPADDWVTSICDAAARYQKVSDAQGEKIVALDFSDTKASKKALSNAFGETDKASDTLRSDFDKAGKPDLKSGDDVVKAFHDQFKENDTRSAELKKKIDGIDEKGDFTEQFQKIVSATPDINFKPKLEAIADKQADAQQVIDGIDGKPDCADLYFSTDSDSAAEPTGGSTPVAKGPTSTPAKTVNEKWVAGICTSFTGWVKDIDDANTELQTGLGKFDASKDSPKDLKQKLVDFLKTGQTETKNLKKEIDALKAPDVKDGAAIHKVFTQAGTDLVKIFDSAVADAEKINASSFRSVSDDITGFESKIAESFDAVGAAFDDLDSYNAPELEKAFTSRSECSDLN